jgi:hypothetical protein
MPRVIKGIERRAGCRKHRRSEASSDGARCADRITFAIPRHGLRDTSDISFVMDAVGNLRGLRTFVTPAFFLATDTPRDHSAK